MQAGWMVTIAFSNLEFPVVEFPARRIVVPEIFLHSHSTISESGYDRLTIGNDIAMALLVKGGCDSTGNHHYLKKSMRKKDYKYANNTTRETIAFACTTST